MGHSASVANAEAVKPVDGNDIEEVSATVDVSMGCALMLV
jgi:hypothetical protein